MIPVAAALEELLALAARMPEETVPLDAAHGRVLARDVVATQAQPPFRSSAMDGYAVAQARCGPGDEFRVVGESAAGHPYPAAIDCDAAVRIFTGAVVPDGAVRVVIQEDTTPLPGAQARIAIAGEIGAGENIRPAGGDFDVGHVVAGGRRLGHRDIALLAAMGVGELCCRRRPEVAILATGDELLGLGEAHAPGHVHASNGPGLAALLRSVGARPRLLPIARDDAASLEASFALAHGADLLITLGGASVGDHDLVAPAAAAAGIDLSFHKVAMRPGKPMMAGRRDDLMMIGLPGNPVSALVCGVVFVQPVIDAMLGLPPADNIVERRLADPLPRNGPRQHYMRARDLGDGRCRVFERQDSSLLTVLADADVLVVRPPNDPEWPAGAVVAALPLPA
jgi:molybdopterin molybdotransferase